MHKNIDTTLNYIAKISCPFCGSIQLTYNDSFIMREYGKVSIFDCVNCGREHLEDEQGNLVSDT